MDAPSSNDRSLLRLAAKAAEIEILRFEKNGDPKVRHELYGECVWNPFVLDGDAFRLAVKLQIQWRERKDAYIYAWSQGVCGASSKEALGDDLCGAIRRAIVRTAAAIAKKSTHST